MSRIVDWKLHISSYLECSNKSMKAFCRERHIHYEGFRYQFNKYKKASSTSLVPVRQNGQLMPVIVNYSNGKSIRISCNQVDIHVEDDFNPSHLKKIVNTLKGY